MQMIEDQLINIAIRAALSGANEILKQYKLVDPNITIKSDRSPVTSADVASETIIKQILAESMLPIISEETDIQPYAVRKNFNYYWLVDPLDGTKEYIAKNDEFAINIALIKKNKPIWGVIVAPALNTLWMGGENHPVKKALLPDKFELNDPSKLINNLIFISPSQVENPTNTPILLTSRHHLNKETNELITHISKQFDVVCNAYGSSLKQCLIADGSADLYFRFGTTMEWDTAAGHALLSSCDCSLYSLPHLNPLAYNKQSLENESFICYNNKPSTLKIINFIQNHLSENR